MAGGTSTCDTSIEKFARPCRRAWKSAIALAGAVVSNPIPKKATRRCGFSRAMRSASSGEYTTRTSAPLLFSVRRSPRDPGTRSMSPNDVKMRSGWLAMACARSIISSDVTQTGQPGPCTSSIVGGIMRSSP
jgi:hypothetical protein